MLLTFKDRDLATKKWSTSITEAKNPARKISLKSFFFLIPMTTAQDHMPITPCTALSDRARSQWLCWMMDNCRSLSATRQNIPRPRLARRDRVLHDWSRACVFSVSDAITNHASVLVESHRAPSPSSCGHSSHPNTERRKKHTNAYYGLPCSI